MLRDSQRWSRRNVLRAGSVALLTGAAVADGMTSLAAAAERVRAKISDVQTMTVQGPGRSYVYVRVLTSDGHSGIAEAYGSPGVAVAEQIMAIRPALIGKDPLEIDRIYTFLGDGASSLAGSRTDGSAHQLMRAASGIEMALWDLAGNLLATPTAVLMGGQFRDHVRVYDHSRPRDMSDKASCREWAAKVNAHPSGFTAHKIDIPRTDTLWTEKGRSVPDNGKDPGNRQLTAKELRRIGQGFENMREAIGWEHDLMVHCHWELDLPSSIQLAQVVAPAKPLWLEDPLAVDYSESWKRLAERSPVPILTGENLTRREGFQPFIVNQGCHIVNPDLRNSGGFLETKRIADLASLYGLPITTHNTASQLHTYQVCQWAACIRDFLMCETITGEGGWMDQVLRLDGPYIEKGYVKVNDKPGTGVELNREVVEAHLAPGQKWWGGA
ncbi:MAG: mandelate racemase/muconate lactonizing enzyme family protein [Caulobacter sp.]|nr:mandelate racemase/muconate lactonizing enzyme family protein [Caulobacter sp.]